MIPDLLVHRLRELQGGRKPARYVVGFSGGLDSAVLVHALKRAVGDDIPILALHINHGLHADAAQWEEHCRRAAAAFGVDFLARRVSVDDRDRVGVEAAARAARYAAMKELMQDGDVLLSAHHEEDQAETVLLNLMRGSGLAGLAAIGARQEFGPGLLLRPMLGVSRQAMERYARESGLDWVEDPSNADTAFDRNYLRREILPRLRQRWPAVSQRLATTAGLAAEAANLQDDLARFDLAAVLLDPGDGSARPDRLDVAGLRKLTAARQRNVLRFAVRACGLPPAPATRLRQVHDELLPAREDAQPLVRWRGAEARRYRGKLYLLSRSLVERTSHDDLPVLYGDGKSVRLGTALGALRLLREDSPGIDPQLVASGLHIRFRAGGEKIVLYGREEESRPLKKLLQERGVVPWMRQNVPLLYAGNKLAAVADLWLAADCARDPGFRVCWDDKPSLF